MFIRRSTVLGPALVLFAALACQPKAAPGPAAPTPGDGAAAGSAAAVEPDRGPEKHHRGKRRHKGGQGHGPGQGRLFRAALRHLELTDEQRSTVQSLMDELESDRKPEHPGALRALLAKSVRAGQLDRARLDAELDKIPAEMQARLAKHADALNRLHQVLTPKQRQQLAQVVQKSPGHARGKGHRGKRGHGHGHGGEGHGARGKGHGGPGKGHGAHGKGHGAHGAFGMLRGLQLTDAQRELLRTAFEKEKEQRPNREAMQAEFERMREQRAALLAAFAKHDFDAKQHLPSGGPPGHLRQWAERPIRFLELALPILDAAQREQLAERIEEGPAFGRGRGHGPRGHGYGDRGGPPPKRE